ncbi:MAG: DUF637 domain-containing protein [Agarilytica sp.]
MGTLNQKNTAYIPKTSRLSFKLWAYFLTFLTVIMPVAPSMAAQLADSQIQYEFDLDPVYERLTSPDFQYRAPSYIESSTPSATSISGFYDRIEAEHKIGLGDPTWVPISGDITIFIPTYPQYKYIGTPLVQSRYIRTQVNALLGRTLIDSTDPAYQTEADQLNTLYNNAFTYIQNTPGLVFGQKLNRDQDGSGLLQDLVWPELRVVNGEEVIVPVVYLTQSTIDQQRVEDNVTTFNGNLSVGSLTIEGVTINTGRDTFIQVANHLVNDGGTITSPDELKIVTGGTFANLSGLVEATNGDLIIGAHSVQNRTIVYRYDTGNDQGYRYGDVASINAAEGSVVLRSYSDIIFSGAEASAGNELTLVADGSIYIGAQQLYEGHSSRGGRTTRSSVSYLQSTLSATDTIKLIAQGEIKIEASDIVSDEGHIELLAGLGITVEDELASTRSYHKGKYGRKSVEESAYQTVAIRSVLDAGKGIRLHTGLGDITLKAADITSTEGASVTASGGAINMLMAVETDHYSYNSVTKKLFTIKTVSRGHNIETAVPNTIVGGFQAEALYGLNVEYEGNPDLSFDEQVAELGQMPGMEWMDEIRNDPAYADVNWEAVELEYDEWSESSTSLNAAAIAVIMVVVAVCTAGAGAAMLGAMGTTATGATSVAGAMMNAAFTSMVGTATVAVANTAVDGGNFEDVLKAAHESVHSDEGLKSVAIAVVTAGAISAIDTQFFTPTAEEIQTVGNNAYTVAHETAFNEAIVNGATEAQATASAVEAGVSAAQSARDIATQASLGQQAIQAVTHSTVSVGIRTLADGGSLDDFEDGFVMSLANNVINIIGRNVASKIGDAAHAEPPNISVASQYIAHAALGCVTGTLTSEVNDTDAENGCLSGSVGAVIGEAIAQGNRAELEEQLKEDVVAWAELYLSSDGDYTVQEFDSAIKDFLARGVDLAKLTAAFGAFIVGGDINVAASAAGNAATYNANTHTGGLAVAAHHRFGLRTHPVWALFNDAFGTSFDRVLRVLNGEQLDLSSDTLFQQELDRNGTLSNAVSAVGERALNNAKDNVGVLLAMLVGSLQSEITGRALENTEDVDAVNYTPVELDDIALDTLQREVRNVLWELSWAEQDRRAYVERNNSGGVEDSVGRIANSLAHLASLIESVPSISREISDAVSGPLINVTPELDPPSDEVPDLEPIITLIFQSWESIAEETGLGGVELEGFPIADHGIPDQLTTPVIDRLPNDGLVFNDSGEKDFPNQMEEDLETEREMADSHGVVPIKVDDENFADIANGGPIKWVVTPDGELWVVPKFGDDIKHSIASGGGAVIAAGEAEIVVGEGIVIGDSINRRSGHYEPTAQSLDIGVEAFGRYGIEFDEIDYKLPD